MDSARGTTGGDAVVILSAASCPPRRSALLAERRLTACVSCLAAYLAYFAPDLHHDRVDVAPDLNVTRAPGRQDRCVSTVPAIWSISSSTASRRTWRADEVDKSARTSSRDRCSDGARPAHYQSVVSRGSRLIYGHSENSCRDAEGAQHTNHENDLTLRAVGLPTTMPGIERRSILRREEKS